MSSARAGALPSRPKASAQARIQLEILVFMERFSSQPPGGLGPARYSIEKRRRAERLPARLVERTC
jgi:hypothetical protein